MLNQIIPFVKTNTFVCQSKQLCLWKVPFAKNSSSVCRNKQLHLLNQIVPFVETDTAEFVKSFFLLKRAAPFVKAKQYHLLNKHLCLLKQTVWSAKIPFWNSIIFISNRGKAEVSSQFQNRIFCFETVNKPQVFSWFWNGFN